MDQLRDFADPRLLDGCVYCGGLATTRDHVPSRCLLDKPYPENLPVVPACEECNKGISQDEEYLVCLVEAAVSGSAEPDKFRRKKVANTLRHSTALQARILSAMKQTEDRIEFAVEEERFLNVMLKLARGHAAFELSQPCRGNPDYFWCGPLSALTDEQCEEFNAAHVQHVLGEIGSRGQQRTLVTQMTLLSLEGERSNLNLIVNDWVDVQYELYRYLAYDEGNGLYIRIVIAEFLACEVIWRQ